MNKRKLILLVGLLTLYSTAFSAEVGAVSRVSGSAEIRSKDGKVREAKVKEQVNVADTISTSAGSQVMIRLMDKSTLLVRENSRVVIEDFQFQKKPDDRISTDVSSGAIRAVTGEIGKERPSNVRYSAGTATVGIRGTDIEVAIIGEGRKDRPGIYNYVYDGKTEMTLVTGEKAEVTKEMTGFTPSRLEPGEQRLQVLRDRPAFLQSSGFDTLIQQLTTPRILR